MQSTSDPEVVNATCARMESGSIAAVCPCEVERSGEDEAGSEVGNAAASVDAAAALALGAALAAGREVVVWSRPDFVLRRRLRCARRARWPMHPA